MAKRLPFLDCLMDCNLLDLGFIGSKYTWCNGRFPEDRIWKRLDRVVANDEWIKTFPDSSISHLIRTGSDQSPVFFSFSTGTPQRIKYFKFLDFWTEQPDYLGVIQNAWNIEVHGNPMWKMHLKLKNVRKHLSWWSKNSIGDIF